MSIWLGEEAWRKRKEVDWSITHNSIGVFGGFFDDIDTRERKK